jgi:hypothetical protein
MNIINELRWLWSEDHKMPIVNRILLTPVVILSMFLQLILQLADIVYVKLFNVDSFDDNDNDGTGGAMIPC